MVFITHCPEIDAEKCVHVGLIAMDTMDNHRVVVMRDVLDDVVVCLLVDTGPGQSGHGPTRRPFGIEPPRNADLDEWSAFQVNSCMVALACHLD